MQRFDDVGEYLRSSDRWHDEIVELRPTLVGRGLEEVVKWGKPCYVHDGRNICILQEMKDFLAVMFFKGALLEDPQGVLVDQGPNSRSARRIEITSVDDVRRLAGTISDYVAEAIRVEDRRLSVPAAELVLVDELRRALDDDAALSEAFAQLTPGRQREYNLHVGGAKQTETRVSRVEQCRQRILAAKGLRDRP